MPNGDGTGPDGKGRMTGRGAGYCSGSNQPGNRRPGSSRVSGSGLRNGLRRIFGGRGQRNSRKF